MKKWLGPGIALPGLASLAATANQWAPLLLTCVRVVAPDFIVEGTDKHLVEVPPDQYSELISLSTNCEESR